MPFQELPPSTDYTLQGLYVKYSLFTCVSLFPFFLYLSLHTCTFALCNSTNFTYTTLSLRILWTIAYYLCLQPMFDTGYKNKKKIIKKWVFFLPFVSVSIGMFSYLHNSYNIHMNNWPYLFCITGMMTLSFKKYLEANT